MERDGILVVKQFHALLKAAGVSFEIDGNIVVQDGEPALRNQSSGIVVGDLLAGLVGKFLLVLLYFTNLLPAVLQLIL